MTSISPRMASEFAETVYDVIEPGSEGVVRLNTYGMQFPEFFDVNLSAGPVIGKTGGIFGLFRDATGFAFVAHGKGKYEGHHVVAVRGSKSINDWMTNGNIGFSSSIGGSYVHTGFNQTFESMRAPLEKLLTPLFTGRPVKGIHCVGHSLGGALAALTSEWIRHRYRKTVQLYTFGAPRVGMKGFATQSSFGEDRIYRCTHGADPVPLVPLWPFMHAPVDGIEYRLDAGNGLSKAAHIMGQDGEPGYRNTANSSDWTMLHQKAISFLHTPVRLDYERRHEASFSNYWADKLAAALVTLLKDAGYYSAVLAQAAISTTLTFYDLLARTLKDIAGISKSFASQARGLLGHMLAFARAAVTTVVEMTFDFIRWVFDRTSEALYSVVRQAVERI